MRCSFLTEIYMASKETVQEFHSASNMIYTHHKKSYIQ